MRANMSETRREWTAPILTLAVTIGVSGGLWTPRAAAEGFVTITVASDASEPPAGTDPGYTYVPLIQSVELPASGPVSRTVGVLGGAYVLKAVTNTMAVEVADPTQQTTFGATFYFRPDAIFDCTEDDVCTPSSIDRVFHARYGGAWGSVVYEDGTPLVDWPVSATGSAQSAIARTVALSQLGSIVVYTTPAGTFSFTVDEFPAPDCPWVLTCDPIPVNPGNNWLLPVLGDGGVDDPSKIDYPEPLSREEIWSNGPGQLVWDFTVSHENLEEPLVHSVNVVSSESAAVPTFQIPIKDEDPEEEEGDEDDREPDDDSPEKDVPEEVGGPCVPTSDGNPVSVFTGNVFLDQTDVVLSGLRGDVAFRRAYNHKNERSGPLGVGWSHSFEKRVEEIATYVLKVWKPNGVAQYFSDPDRDGVFTVYGNPDGGRSWLSRTMAPDGYRREFRSGGHEVYDAQGRLTVRADRVGRETTFTYGPIGYSGTEEALTEILTPEGRKLTLEYDGFANYIRRVLGPEGLVAEYSYEYVFPSHRMTRVRYADGTGYRFTHDAENRIVSVADLAGVVTDRHGFDDQNRAAWTEVAGGRQHRIFTYAENETVVTDANGQATVYEWIDTIVGRRVTRVAGACGQCSAGMEERRWEYDDQGRITHYFDGENNETINTWSLAVLGGVERIVLERVERIVDSGSSQLTVYEDFDEYGRARQITRTGWGTTSIAWGAEGPLTITQPGSAQPLAMTYVNHRLATITSPEGLQWQYDINDLGEIVSGTDPRGGLTSYGYDVMGRLVTVTGPDQRTIEFERDVGGRVLALRRPDGRATQFVYNASGRIARVTDEAGNPHSYSYDAIGRLEKILDSRNGTTKLAYDIMSRVTSLTDAKRQETEFILDDFGRVEGTENPVGDIEQYTYYKNGRLKARIDRNGATTTYTYDGVGRLIGKDYTGTAAMPPWSADYDDVQRSVTYTNGTSTIVRTFDPAGRLASELSDDGVNPPATVRYAYNDDGQRLSLELDDVTFVNYSYVDGLLASIERNGSLFEFTYDDLGRRETMSYPNGVVTTYDYDDTLGWLLGIDAVNNGGGSVLHVAYEHDALGNRTLKTVDDLTERYEYDKLSRLVKVIRQSPDERVGEYTYDAVGNRLQEAVDGAPLSYQYDAANRLLGRSPGGTVRVAGTTDEPATVLVDGQPTQATAGLGFEGAIEASGASTFQIDAQDVNENSAQVTYALPAAAGETTYEYDPNGNLIQKTENGETWDYVWNAENQLIRVCKDLVPPQTCDSDGVAVASFRYDPLGRRVQKSDSAGGNTTYTYDAHEVLRRVEADPSGTSTHLLVSALGVDDPLGEEVVAGGGPSALSYYHADGLGSIVAQTDAAGGVVESRSYDAWGRPADVSVSGPSFTGREWDAETRLHYYRARYYDPKIGRFLSEDPIGFQAGDVNFYAYVRNNPVLLTDPTGKVIQVCNRPAQGMPGNHSYLYDPRTGRNCGRGSNSGKEDPTSDPNTKCVTVPGSEGKEDEVLKCCEEQRKHPGVFFPPVNDCHVLKDKTLDCAGLPRTPAPGGRLGCPTCPPAPPNQGSHPPPCEQCHY
jgi:RHS repeat-associated protein